MVGQSHVLRTLTKALDGDRVHHAFLFTGTRGVGKTTVARILAKSLNCECGVSSTPCGECSACVEIDGGRFIDLIEVDAASRAKVEETRELLDNVQYMPTRGRYKVYLIDEVHMFSRHSFNALLKTLEEPPPHVKFLLATTDPQRLPVTVLSRCLQFPLRRLRVGEIEQQLLAIVTAEGGVADPGALRQLAVAADGSMRDGLSLLDQAMAYGGPTLRESEIQSMLGSVDRRQVIALVDKVVRREIQAAVILANELINLGADPSELLAEMCTCFSRIAVLQAIPDLEDEADADVPALRTLAQSLEGEVIQLLYQIALIGRRDLPLAPDPKSGLEMVLLRLLAFTPVDDVQSFEDRGEGTSPKIDASVHPKETVVASKALKTRASPSSAVGTRQKQFPEDRLGDSDKVETRSSTSEEGESIHATLSSVLAEDQQSNGTEKVGRRAIPCFPDEINRRGWDEILPELGLTGLTAELAANMQVSRVEGSLIELMVNPGHSALLIDAAKQRLMDALLNRYPEIRIHIEVGEVAGDTPAMLYERKRLAKQTQAEQSIDTDPRVRAIVERFDARVEPGSVHSIK